MCKNNALYGCHYGFRAIMLHTSGVQVGFISWALGLWVVPEVPEHLRPSEGPYTTSPKEEHFLISGPPHPPPEL